MMIKEFEEIYTKGHIPQVYGLLENIERRIRTYNGKASLTQLQKTVLGHPKFWYSENVQSKNIIIQGATSAGKTLLAELLALQCLWKKDKQRRQVVYLVPLKALVSEKRKQFEEDMGGQHVYGSSSDYQDHDTELIEGNYDVAVVVYEKFFAMLADLDTNKFLRDCRLIVVDEIQLLSSPDRGEKLEYALTKVMRKFGNQIRIMGLTTVDCDISHVKNWLDADIIKETSRPVPLTERVIDLTGHYWERYVEDDFDASQGGIYREIKPVEGNIPVPAINNALKEGQKKVELLRALLKSLYKQDKNTKVIVFVSSRKKCSWLAKEICNGEVLSQQEFKFSKALQELKKMDFYDKKDSIDWEERLLPSGIAYHSAELSMSMRELIESEFKKDNGMIRLIVATETLMIGMNLPADVMILFDDEVIRSSGENDTESKLLNPQEYKNYIGRAGRLGISNRNGESYFLVMDKRQIGVKWNRYVNAKIESISSALLNSDAVKMGPYFLNLLCNKSGDTFSLNDVKESYHKTLKFAEIHKTDGCEKILELLEKAKLIQKELNTSTFIDFFNENETLHLEKYIPTQFGRAMAPYALSLDSCVRIYHFFVQDGYGDKLHGLPLNYTGQDLAHKKYLLDILYTICEINEVKKLKYPSLPNGRQKNYKLQESFMALIKSIREFLKDYRLKNGGENAFWRGSILEGICNGTYDANYEAVMNNALRAILLYLWIQGNLMEDIKKKIGLGTNIKFSISSGDLSRLGEVSSYIIEAIANCLYTNEARMDENNGKIGPLSHAFRILSSQIKYGMTDPDLLLISKTNVPGVSRKTIINLGQLAKVEKYESLSLMINSGDKRLKEFLLTEQLRELKKRLNNFIRPLKKDIERLYEQGRLPKFSPEKYRECLEQLASPDNEDIWKNSLKTILCRICPPVDEMYDAKGKLNGCIIERENGRFLYIIFYMHKEGDDFLSCNSNVNEYLKKLNLEIDSDILFVVDNKQYLDSLSELDDENAINEFKVKFMSSVDFCRYTVEIFDKVGDGLSISERSGTAKFIMTKILINAYKLKGIRGCRDLIQRLVKQYKNGEDDIDQDINGIMNKKEFKYVKKITDNVYVYQKSNDEAFRRAVKLVMIPDNFTGVSDPDSINVIPDEDGLKKQADILGKTLKEANIDFFAETNTERLYKEICNCFKNKLHCSLEDTTLTNIIKKAVKDVAKKAENKNSTDDYATALVCYFIGERAYEEVNCMYKLSRTPNIVTLHDVYKTPLWEDSEDIQARFQIIIEMDLMDGNLEQEIGNFGKNDIITLGRKMCNALQKCHDQNIVHRDIKPANILYSKEKCGEKDYFLSDFGIAATVGEIKNNTMGTEVYMAPDEVYSPQSDIYSLGKTLLKLYRKDQRNADLLNVLEKASSLNISDRYLTMADFATALESVNDARSS